MKKMISRRNFLKVCAVAGSAVALSACGGSKKAAGPDPSNTDQTSFDIVGGQSALSPGYNDNEVLKKLADNVGVKLNYETMSDSLSEQVNIRIAGDQLPDAFMGVGFSNYDIANYGADGTFLDLTPYINAEIMPNLTKILDEHPNIRAAITMSDGCIYGLPAAEQMGHCRHRCRRGLQHLHHSAVLHDQQALAGRAGAGSAHHAGRAAHRPEGFQGQRYVRQGLRQRSRQHHPDVHRF